MIRDNSGKAWIDESRYSLKSGISVFKTTGEIRHNRSLFNNRRPMKKVLLIQNGFDGLILGWLKTSKFSSFQFPTS